MLSFIRDFLDAFIAEAKRVLAPTSSLEIVQQDENVLILKNNTIGEKLVGCSSVPVLEVDEGTMEATVARAKSAGAVVVLDGLSNPKMNSIVLASPGGHEFELCNCKAHD